MNALFLLKPKADVALLYDDNTLRRGLELMRSHGFTAIPVITREGDYIGSISEGDFLWHMIDSEKSGVKTLETTLIRDAIRKDWTPSVRVDVTMDDLLDRATCQNFVPVTDDRNKFIGIITRRDIITYFKDKFTDEE